MLPRGVVRGRKNPLYFGLAARLKAARLSQGYDRKTLTSQAALVGGSVILGIEDRGKTPHLDTIEKVATALGLSPAFLAYGIEADADPPTDSLSGNGLASRLWQVRTQRGLSVLALAQAAGLSHTAVGNIERGTVPNVATAESLARALGVSPGWLAYGLGPMELPGRRRLAAPLRQASPEKGGIAQAMGRCRMTAL